jgi:RimJ/RimL family protein N-acetyltransferase
MASQIPAVTIDTFARSIFREAKRYGFDQIDVVRLVNALMDMSIESGKNAHQDDAEQSAILDTSKLEVNAFPLISPRLEIRLAGPSDTAVLGQWLEDEYGQHFLLSCASAQSLSVETLLSHPNNEVGIVELTHAGGAREPIGAVAYLDLDRRQQRAELRKLIGSKNARGKGYAEEATMLWIEYGISKLRLRKIYVSTLQTNLRNIRLNESIGFRVEGILRGEVQLGTERHDVLRMGLIR